MVKTHKGIVNATKFGILLTFIGSLSLGTLSGCSSAPSTYDDATGFSRNRVKPNNDAETGKRYSQNTNKRYSPRKNSRSQMQRSSAARVTVATPERVSYAALDRLRYRVNYDGRYVEIPYPNGDVPANMGVCTDTVIRAYRKLGIDLQKYVHEDMSRNFYAYPNLPKWNEAGPDPNIDHRRVHNLKAFFTRHGARVPATNNPRDYRPGDLVTWSLGGDQEHIGIVVDRKSSVDPDRYLVVHNIGEGERLEDVLFKMPISGHFRYFPRCAQG
jgi:hypothetical protein